MVVASEGDKQIEELAEHVITVPAAVELLMPIVEATVFDLAVCKIARPQHYYCFSPNL